MSLFYNDGRILGKGEVEVSITSCSTNIPLKYHGLGIGVVIRSCEIAQNVARTCAFETWKIRGKRTLSVLAKLGTRPSPLASPDPEFGDGIKRRIRGNRRKVEFVLTVGRFLAIAGGALTAWELIQSPLILVGMALLFAGMALGALGVEAWNEGGWRR